MKKFFVVALSFSLLWACTKETNTPEEENNQQTINKSANLLGTGASAADLLGNENYDHLLVQIAYVSDFRPTEEAVANFLEFLTERTFKQTISVEYLELDSPNLETLDLETIADLEAENRTAYNTDRTLAIYIYFTDAASEDDDLEAGTVTLGAVYRNTSMVIYEKTVRTLAGRSLFISNADVETATLNHEFGHLFGLVNIGTTPVNDHEGVTTDENGNEIGNNHCTEDNCLMRSELQFNSPNGKGQLSLAKIDGDISAPCNLNGETVLQLLTQSKNSKSALVPDLGTECLLDLQSNGGK